MHIKEAVFTCGIAEEAASSFCFSHDIFATKELAFFVCLCYNVHRK